MNALKRHMSPSLVIALLALAVAVGGSAAIAASNLGRNTVASKHIKPNTIKPADVNEGKFYIGVEVNDSGAVTESTIPGVSADGFTGDQTIVTFPRDVTKCIPVGMGTFSGNITGFQSGTAPANRNKVTINNDGGAKSFSLILVCR